MARNCNRCHTCGEELVQVPWPVGQGGLDGEQWCPTCQTYRRYRSHGWPRASSPRDPEGQRGWCDDARSECPDHIEPLNPSEPDYGRWLEELMGIEWCQQNFPEGYYDGHVATATGDHEAPRTRDDDSPGQDVAQPLKPLAIRACHDGPLPAVVPTCPTCGRVIGAIGIIRVPSVGKNPARQRARLTRRLRHLRLDIERELAGDGLDGHVATATGFGVSAQPNGDHDPCLTDDQAAMLIDVCRALGLDKTETRYVVGPAYRILTEDRGWISR